MNSNVTRNSGFTLVEALIALTVTLFLGTALIGLILGQSNFYGRSDDAIAAQQNLRAAADLMASELRLAGPRDLMVATPDSVTVRFDLVRAVVCDSTGSDQVTVVVYDTATTAAITGSFRGMAYSGPLDSTFVYADGWTAAVDATGSTPEATCTGLGAPAGLPPAFYRSLSGWQGQFGDLPDRGSAIRLYGSLTYRLGPSALGPGIAIFRDAQELVAPLGGASQLRYVMADSSEQGTVSGANLVNVRAIRLDFVAIGDGVNRYGVSRSLNYDIPLRN